MLNNNICKSISILFYKNINNKEKEKKETQKIEILNYNINNLY
jgi:hypothetical protein